MTSINSYIANDTEDQAQDKHFDLTFSIQTRTLHLDEIENKEAEGRKTDGFAPLTVQFNESTMNFIMNREYLAGIINSHEQGKTNRCDANIRGIQCVVVDFDHPTQYGDDILSIVHTKFKELGISHSGSTSTNHHKPKKGVICARGKFIVPFNEIIDVSTPEKQSFWKKHLRVALRNWFIEMFDLPDEKVQTVDKVGRVSTATIRKIDNAGFNLSQYMLRSTDNPRKESFFFNSGEALDIQKFIELAKKDEEETAQKALARAEKKKQKQLDNIAYLTENGSTEDAKSAFEFLTVANPHILAFDDWRAVVIAGINAFGKEYTDQLHFESKIYGDYDFNGITQCDLSGKGSIFHHARMNGWEAKKSKLRFREDVKPTFNNKFTSIEEASAEIEKVVRAALLDVKNSEKEVHVGINSTVGTGKSDAMLRSVVGMILDGEASGLKINIYLDNKKDQLEVYNKLKSLYSEMKKKNGAFFISGGSSELKLVRIRGRENTVNDSDRIDVTIIEDNMYGMMCPMQKTYQAKREEAAITGMPSVKEYCLNDCIHGLNLSLPEEQRCNDLCPYIKQFKEDATIRLKNHVHLHGVKGTFDNDDWLDESDKVVHIVDEDIAKDLVNDDTHTLSSIARLKEQDIKVDSLYTFCNEKATGILDQMKMNGIKTVRQNQILLLESLFSHGIELSCEAIQHPLNQDRELYSRVSLEIELLEKLQRHVEYSLDGVTPIQLKVDIIAKSLVEGKNKAGIYIKEHNHKLERFMVLHHVRRKTVKVKGSVIQLDAHANKEFLDIAYGADFDMVSVNVENQGNVIAVNMTGSKQSISKDAEPQKLRKAAIKEFASGKYTIGSKSLWDNVIPYDLNYGACRGTNSIYERMQKTGKPLVLLNNYKVSPDAVEKFHRAYYPDLGTPDMSMSKRSEVRRMKDGNHQILEKVGYCDYRSQMIDDFHSRSEMEQAIGRARLVRFDATVYVLADVVLDLTYSSVIEEEDLLGTGDGDVVIRKKKTSSKKADIIFNSMKAKSISAIMAKPKEYKAMGLSKKQAECVEIASDDLEAHDMVCYDVIVKDNISKKSKQRWFMDRELCPSNNDYGKKIYVSHEEIRW